MAAWPLRCSSSQSGPICVTGVYYPTGGAICRLVNQTRKETGILCAVESTGGSVHNINTLKAGELKFGVAQSDWQYHAYKGTPRFADKPFPELRAVFSVHPKPFTLIARSDRGNTGFEDIKGLGAATASISSSSAFRSATVPVGGPGPISPCPSSD